MVFGISAWNADQRNMFVLSTDSSGDQLTSLTQQAGMYKRLR